MLKRTPIQLNTDTTTANFHDWLLPTRFDEVETELARAKTGVVLGDGSVNGRFLVEGQADVFGLGELTMGRGVVGERGAFYRLRRDLLFVRTRPGQTLELPTTTQHVTLTDITHGQTEIQIIGPHSAALLSHACGLDFSDTAFPNLTAKYSRVAKTRQLIIRHDQSGLPVYALIGDRSLAAYLWETLLVSGRGLSVVPIGQLALAQITL